MGIGSQRQAKRWLVERVVVAEGEAPPGPEPATEREAQLQDEAQRPGVVCKTVPGPGPAASVVVFLGIAWWVGRRRD